MPVVRALRPSILLVVGILASGCQSRDALDPPELVPAGEAVSDPGRPLVARYWAELAPTGRLDLYKIHPGNLIYRGASIQSGLHYDYEGTATQDPSTTCATPPCLPGAANMVTLHTDQAGVTYVDGSGTCYANGKTFANDPSCGGKLPDGDTCRRLHVFCAPIAMVSSVTFGQAVGAMPNVVLQITDPFAGGQPNRVVGCNDQDPTGDASGEHGLCAFTNASKVDDPTTSDLVSPIAGDGVNNFGCSFCYGNQFQAVTRGLPGLQDTVLSDAPANGVDPTLAAVNTDKLVLDLENDDNLDMVITVRYAAPSLDPAGQGTQLFYDDTAVTPTCPTPPCPASCLTRGATRMTLTGASFGPPGACLTGTQPITSCPAEGAPAAAYRLQVPGFATPQAPAIWSDTRVEFTPPPATTTECGVRLTTPVGSTVTSDPVDICDDQWRAWTPTLNGVPVARLNAAVGVLTFGGEKFIVMAGGRTLPGQLGSNVDTTLIMPVPTCANPNPNWSTVSVSGAAPPNRWGMAHTVANNRLWVLGGSLGGTIGNTACGRGGKVFTLTGPTSGTWANLPNNIPDMDSNNNNQGLCDATMVTMRSSTNHEWIVVTGGSVRPVPNNACTGGNLPTLNSGRYTLVLDPTSPTLNWATFFGINSVDNDGATAFQRFGGVGAVNAAGSAGLVVAGSQSPTGPGDTTTKATRLTINIAGVPTFVDTPASADLPAGTFLASAASADNAIYVAGGATAVGVVGACNNSTRGNLPSTNRLLRIDGGFAGPWTLLAGMPAARVEHSVVAVESTGGTEDKLYVIGGSNGAGTAATQVFEYTP